jgi:hypothetical protein
LAIVPGLSPSMASDAFKELRALAADRRYHDAAAGTRDYDAAIRDLDEMWRSLFHAGAIKPVALKRGVRAENAAVGADSDVDGDFDSCCLVGSGPRRVFTAAETRAQRNCRNCFGFRHLMAVCPSASGIRPLATSALRCYAALGMAYRIRSVGEVVRAKAKAEPAKVAGDLAKGTTQAVTTPR